MSEAVRVLESRLGVKIFERTSRRVRLTPEGEEFKRNLVPALDQARLASNNTLSIEDLADEEVALLPPTTPQAVYDLIVPPRTLSGRPIRRTQPVQTINEILSLVARGRIVHPTSSTVPIFNRDDVALIPIDDLPPCHSGWFGAPAATIPESVPSTKSPAQWPQHPAPHLRPSTSARHPQARTPRIA